MARSGIRDSRAINTRLLCPCLATIGALMFAASAAADQPLAGNARAVTFRHGDSNTALTYSGLKAWDAVDTPLEARIMFAAERTKLHLVASIVGASWPITVDPTFTQAAQLSPTLESDTSHAEFGQAVAVDGDLMAIALIGAPYDDDHGSRSGSAYLHDRNQGGPDAWGQVAKTTADDGGSDHQFGQSVSISGDTAVVGAPNHVHLSA